MTKIQFRGLIFLICLILTYTHFADAREKTFSGYIINLNNDTIEGHFQIKNDRKIYNEVEFKQVGNEQYEKIYPGEILGFVFSSQRFISTGAQIFYKGVENPFERNKIITDTVTIFMREIVDGTLKLYYARVYQRSGIEFQSNELFKIRKGEDHFYQIKESNVIGMLNIVTNDLDGFARHYRNKQQFVLYDLFELSDIVEKYNREVTKTYVKNEDYLTKRNTEYKIWGKVQIGNDLFKYPHFVSESFFWDPARDRSFTGAIQYQMFLPNNHFGIVIGAGFSKHKGIHRFMEQPERVISLHNYDISYFEVSIGPMYDLHIKPFILYLEPGITGNLRMCDNSTILSMSGQTNDFKLQKKAIVGFFGEAGIRFPYESQRLRLGYRYHYFWYDSHDPDNFITVSSNQIVFGISLINADAKY